ncbi:MULTISPECIES: hypothetical protein [Vibrio harveyi group]|uniref:hypothetical protein n=1 Tax=Vibrio harveyi group TaxID=717610 RepID=UPI000ACBD0B5|nr:hypothetical protein [Vibrio parahaemolyticus]EJC7018017.1 hypothetical protein [Vibrio parahaemolyticus]HCE1687794.1 hypothetical protein [Vibrio parahaemolyticus]
MSKRNFLIFAVIVVGIAIYGTLATKSTQDAGANWAQKLDSLWEVRASQINLSDYPNISKSNWCGLYFGNEAAPEQANFKRYLDQYKKDMLSKTQTLAESDLYGNLDGYKKLSCMEPENLTFQNKVSHYKNKIEAENSKQLEKSKSAWSYRVSTDEMTQDKSIYLSSKIGTTIRPMSFPYTGTESAIYFACDKKSKWAYFWFSSKPNIVNDQTESGYSLSKSRIRFDNDLDNITMTQKWGSQFMHARYPDWLSKKLIGKDVVKLELDWHGEGRVIFTYNVHGFKPLYSEFTQKCSTL